MFVGDMPYKNMLVNEHVFILRPKYIYPNFLCYSIQSTYSQYTMWSNVMAAAQPGIGKSFLKRIRVTITDLKYQKEIADFLDKESAIIDLLIEKKKKMIQLLIEKLNSIINKTVIEGLSSNIKIKKSGLEWIKCIPEKWNISKLGFEASVKARLGWKGLKAHEYVDNGYIFLAIPNIKGHLIDFNNVNYISKERYFESPEIMLNEGDILLAKDGSIGICNIIRFLPKPATVNSSIAVIRPKDKLSSLYGYYFFSSAYMQNFIRRMQDGMGVPHLFQSDLRKFFILLPSKDEQNNIGNYLDKITDKIYLIRSKLELNINLLKELRSSLITHAVTGQLDINKWKNRNITEQYTDKIEKDMTS